MKSLTNKKLNQLTIIAGTLPKLQRKNTDGSLMFRAATKRIIGKDLPDSYKKKNDYYPEKYYTLKYEEPVLVNYKQELIEVYEKYGDRGVEDYVISLHKFAELNKKPITKIKNAFGFFVKLKNHFLGWLSKQKLKTLTKGLQTP